MILLVIVGGIFACLGLGILTIRYYFQQNATRVVGKVVAIEKKVSTHTSHHSSHMSVTYHPIIEYVFNGEKVWFSAGGSSNFLHKFKINQKVKVLSLDKGPEYVMLENGVLGIMGKVFLLMGGSFFLLGLYKLYKNPPQNWQDILFDYGVLVVIFPGALAFFYKAKANLKKMNTNIAEEMLKSARLETEDSLNQREVYWTRKQLDKELSKVNQAGLLVSTIFLLISLVALYFSWVNLPPIGKAGIKDFIVNFALPEELSLMLKQKNPKLFLFLISLFFTVASSYSFIYSQRRSRT